MVMILILPSAAGKDHQPTTDRVASVEGQTDGT
jgi:hypothetical protein